MLEQLSVAVFYENPSLKFTRVTALPLAGFPSSRPFCVGFMKE